jgi:hypothetical protein
MSVLTQLQGFLKGQPPELTARLENEIKVVNDLIAVNAKMKHKQRLTNSFSKQIHCKELDLKMLKRVILSECHNQSSLENLLLYHGLI